SDKLCLAHRCIQRELFVAFLLFSGLCQFTSRLLLFLELRSSILKTSCVASFSPLCLCVSLPLRDFSARFYNDLPRECFSFVDAALARGLCCRRVNLELVLLGRKLLLPFFEVAFFLVEFLGSQVLGAFPI